jgi:hypothetical protein
MTQDSPGLPETVIITIITVIVWGRLKAACTQALPGFLAG